MRAVITLRRWQINVVPSRPDTDVAPAETETGNCAHNKRPTETLATLTTLHLSSEFCCLCSLQWNRRKSSRLTTALDAYLKTLEMQLILIFQHTHSLHSGVINYVCLVPRIYCAYLSCLRKLFNELLRRGLPFALAARTLFSCFAKS